VRRRLSRPAVLAAALVLTSLAAGIVYAIVTGRSSSGVEENRRAIATAGVYPGARRIASGSNPFFPENSLPVPRGVVTTVVYRPPLGTKQIEVVDRYLARLRGRWTARLERSLAGAGETRSFRVTFSRDDQCLVLATAGMLLADESQRAYTLSAYQVDGGGC
jgi:hypothetical protein